MVRGKQGRVIGGAINVRTSGCSTAMYLDREMILVVLQSIFAANVTLHRYLVRWRVAKRASDRERCEISLSMKKDLTNCLLHPMPARPYSLCGTYCARRKWLHVL